MGRRRERTKVSTRTLLESTIEELLSKDYELLRYRVLAHRRMKEREMRLLEERLRRISGDPVRHSMDSDVEELKNRLESLRREVELLKTLGAKLTLLDTIRRIGDELEEKSRQEKGVEKGLGERYKELWEGIKKLRLKDLLNYGGDPDDKLALYNYLIGLIKGMELPPPPLETGTVTVARETPLEKPSTAPREEPLQLVVSERDFVAMTVEDWRNLVNRCFTEKKQLELPENYLSPSMRRSLRALLTALLEQPPEKLRFIIPKRYKYLLILHGILFTILVEKKPYVVTPGSSDREYIEGEGGLLDVFEASAVGEETLENLKRKHYIIRVGSREYRIVKEIRLEGGRAKQIRYLLTQ